MSAVDVAIFYFKDAVEEQGAKEDGVCFNGPKRFLMNDNDDFRIDERQQRHVILMIVGEAVCFRSPKTHVYRRCAVVVRISAMDGSVLLYFK